MADATRPERCEDCGKDVPGYDTIHLTLSGQQARTVCTRCFNTRIAVQAGVDFDHPAFESVDEAPRSRAARIAAQNGLVRVACERADVPIEDDWCGEPLPAWDDDEVGDEPARMR